MIIIANNVSINVDAYERLIQELRVFSSTMTTDLSHQNRSSFVAVERVSESVWGMY